MDVTFQTDMTCQSCVSKVRPRLDSVASVKSWTADLSDPRRLVRVQLGEDANLSDVANAIESAGFRATQVVDEGPAIVGLSAPPATQDSDSKKNGFRLSAYGPLFLVVTYVIAAVAFTEWISGGWDLPRAMRHFMGFFFMGFAFFKLLNIPKFADAFATYDVIAKRCRPYALAYPLIEVALGWMFLFNVWPVLASLGTIVVLGVGLFGVVDAVRRKQAIQCACLGTAFNLPMSVVTIIENSVMVLMAVGMLISR